MAEKEKKGKAKAALVPRAKSDDFTGQYKEEEVVWAEDLPEPFKAAFNDAWNVGVLLCVIFYIYALSFCSYISSLQSFSLSFSTSLSPSVVFLQSFMTHPLVISRSFHLSPTFPPHLLSPTHEFYFLTSSFFL